MDQLLAFARIDLVDVLQQGQGVGLRQPGFPGIHLVERLNLVPRKKLLRPGAGGSPRAMVAPIDALHESESSGGRINVCAMECMVSAILPDGVGFEAGVEIANRREPLRIVPTGKTCDDPRKIDRS